MKCPVDNETLVMTERSGVEIDYCPRCRGVWLDRGELDKIIERAALAAGPAEPPRREAPPSYSEPSRGAYQSPPSYGEARYEGEHRKKKKKESFLGELFDF